jgi:hypothetical protein
MLARDRAGMHICAFNWTSKTVLVELLRMPNLGDLVRILDKFCTPQQDANKFNTIYTFIRNHACGPITHHVVGFGQGRKTAKVPTDEWSDNWVILDDGSDPDDDNKSISD